MIKGDKHYGRLTLDDILLKVSELEIYQYYAPCKIKPNRLFCSPFREDENPSMIIYRKGKYLRFLDYSQKQYTGNCVTFVMFLYNLTYGRALKRIENDLAVINKPIRKATEEYYKKERTLIQVITREFTPEDIEYWRKLGITKKDLVKENVFSADRIFINKQEKILREELRFVYFMEEEDGQYVKVYIPKATDRQNKFKTNMPGQFIPGWKNLSKGGRIAIITKSNKDMVILRKIHPEVACIPSENSSCLSGERIKFLQDNFERVYINFDKDKTGLESMERFKSHGFIPLTTPEEAVEKDFAEYVENNGFEKLKKYIEEIVKN